VSNPNKPRERNLILGRFGLFDDLFHDLRLLHKECTHDPLTDASTASAPTICPSNSLLTFRDGSIFTRAKCRDAWQFKFTVTAFRRSCELFDMVIYFLAARSLYNPPTVRCGVVRLALAKSNALRHW